MVTARGFPELGGVESHVQEVSSRLVALGLDVTVATTDRSRRLPRREVLAGVRIERYRAWPKRRDYYLSPGLVRRVARRDYDVLHIQGIHTLVAPLAMVAAVICQRPFVLTFHSGGSSSAFRRRLRRLQFGVLGPLLRQARQLIGVSESERLLFEQSLGNGHTVQVIRNGGTLPQPDRPVDVEPGLIVSSGRLERYKGHHRLIEALPYLVGQIPDVRARILGAGPFEDELRRLSIRHGVEDLVEITAIHPADRAEMGRTIAQAGLVVLFSEYEAHPVAVMEALALGRPVLVAETSGLTELVRYGWARGVPYDASPAAIATAICQQLADPIGIPAKDLPNWDTCVSDLLDVYARARTFRKRFRGRMGQTR
jgi:glycosyltransferase involved in cell wall biosynthesis